MQVINWLALQPQPADLEALKERIQAAVPLHNLCRLLVETMLRASQEGRPDLIPCYHPSQTYKQGQRLALLFPDPQYPQRIVWHLAQVKQTKKAENPVQGQFQVLTLEVRGRQIQMAGGIAGASYPEPDFSTYNQEGLDWLAEWVLEAHGSSLQATVQRLIEKGEMRGQLIGQIFLPEGVAVLSAELLEPHFAALSLSRPWITSDEILKGLPDLSALEPKEALPLLRATLTGGSYRSLGADRWTTPELFQQLDRDVPRGLTTPKLRSSLSLWTKQDKQDLAGYGRRSMPAQARRALEELEDGDSLPQTDAPWRPPKKSLRLPTLNYLHITQACVPVGYLLRAFAPDVKMVFVQFMDGEHQPCLLDRENGLLKAIHPERWRDKILEDGTPAGTSLWLEYEGKEKYRIVPRPLAFKRMLPCKLAHFKEGQLHIEQTQISMKYESSPMLFKANLSREEAAAWFHDDRDLGLREAVIYAMQEICAVDPDHRAHWVDLLNAVLLLRTCSPISVSFLLHTQPCFETMGIGYFRYRPTPEPSVGKAPPRTERLSQLWEKFAADPVAPVPLPGERRIIQAHVERGYPTSPTPVPEWPTFVSQPETEPETSVLPLVLVAEDATNRAEEKDAEAIEALWLHEAEPDSLTAPRTEAPSESEGLSNTPFEDAHAEFSFYSPTLGLEPKPAWTQAPPAKPPSTGAANTQRLIDRRNFPLRPLHKQPLYRRLFYYLRAWLRRTFRSST